MGCMSLGTVYWLSKSKSTSQPARAHYVFCLSFFQFSWNLSTVISEVIRLCPKPQNFAFLNEMMWSCTLLYVFKWSPNFHNQHPPLRCGDAVYFGFACQEFKLSFSLMGERSEEWLEEVRRTLCLRLGTSAKQLSAALIQRKHAFSTFLFDRRSPCPLGTKMIQNEVG